MITILFLLWTLELIYSCRPLRDEATLNTLEHVESGAKMIYATVVKPGKDSCSGAYIPHSHILFKIAEREQPKKLNAVEQHQLFLAFRAAVTNPNFRHTLQNLSKPENIQSLTETVPGLADDEIALSMLQDWELLLHLADPKIVQVLVEKHPALVDAASRMMNSVSESLVPGANQRRRSNSAGWLARSLGADLEDDGMDEDVPQDQPNSNQQTSRPQAAFGSGITPAQLAAALNFAQNSIRRMFKLNSCYYLSTIDQFEIYNGLNRALAVDNNNPTAAAAATTCFTRNIPATARTVNA